MSITNSNSELKVIIPIGSINSSAPQVTFCSSKWAVCTSVCGRRGVSPARFLPLHDSVFNWGNSCAWQTVHTCFLDSQFRNRKARLSEAVWLSCCIPSTENLSCLRSCVRWVTCIPEISCAWRHSLAVVFKALVPEELSQAYPKYCECPLKLLLNASEVPKCRKQTFLEEKQITSKSHKWLCVREKCRCSWVPETQTCFPPRLLFVWPDQHLSEKVTLATGSVLAATWLRLLWSVMSWSLW